MSKGTDVTSVKVSAPGGLPWDAPAGGCQCGGLVQLPWPGTGGQQVSLQRACQGQPQLLQVAVGPGLSGCLLSPQPQALCTSSLLLKTLSM